MPDIKLRDGSGVERTYEGVDTITVPLADGTGSWTYGFEDEDLKLHPYNSEHTFHSLMLMNIISKYNLMSRVDASGMQNMVNIFAYYKGDELDKIEPSFEYNDTGISFNNCFNYCTNITKLPTFNSKFILCQDTGGIFNSCEHLEDISDFIDNINYFNYYYITSGGGRSGSSSFYLVPSISNCFRLKSIDLANYNTALHDIRSTFYSKTSTPYSGGVSYCSELESFINIPVPSADLGFTYTSNFLNYSYGGENGLGRLTHITFAKDSNNQPYVVNWKSQTMDLANGSTQSPGWVSSQWTSTNIMLEDYYNVADSTSSSATLEGTQARYNAYIATGEDDWCCYCGGKQVTYDGGSRYLGLLFSRYNHDSAVETINSLPDTSAYLAQAGGTNTIKFKKYSGACTVQGAIKDLTPEEIAVATAKGWTVTLVD